MPSPDEVRLADSLSEITRKERRCLLASSALGIVMVKTGLVPTKISALGVDFSPTDQKTILGSVAFGVLYFMVGFCIYAASDYMRWRQALTNANRDALKRADSFGNVLPASCTEADSAEARRFFLSRFRSELFASRRGLVPLSVARIGFEFLLPVLLGCYAVFLIWS